MRRLLLSIAAATAAVLGPMAATSAQARDHGEGWSHGDRGNWSGDRGRDHGNWDNNRGNDDRRASRNDRHDDNRWSNRRDDWRSARAYRHEDRWDRRDDRWDRREVRWDGRDDRRDQRWSSRDRWSHGVHNGYYYRQAWYYGPPPARYYNDRYYRPGFRSWERGYRCPDYYRDNVVWDYDDYHLRRPGHGYRWVRADNDFLLVAIASGIIADVIINDY